MDAITISPRDRDAMIKHDVETHQEGASKKSAKEVAEAEPRPAVIEVIARPLQNGHTINIATKVAQDDGTVIDEVLTTSSTEKPLRLELRHLQELMLRAKVVGVVQYDSDQAAVLNVPLPDSPEFKAREEEKAAREAGVPGRREDPDEARVDQERDKTRHSAAHPKR